ncbi:MAG: PCMD domain-containing protein [Muribaculaceae bacterium]|nr:PCMD domain-containing protein [Muribaculaceae bacterium]
MIKKGKICSILFCAMLLLLCGCIKNDIPYPHLDTEIVKISAEGEVKAAAIDAQEQTVMLYLGETVNPESVTISNITLSDGAVLKYPDVKEPLNLSHPIVAVLYQFYEYEWVISATQEIERYFTIDGQIGSAVIDVPNHRVVVDVPESVDIKHLKVMSMKLAPAEVTEYSDNLEGKLVDFSSPVEVTASYFGKSEKWTIYVRLTDVTITLNRIDAWTKVIWVYAAGESGKELGVQYRKSGTDDWMEVPKSMLTINGGEITARISGVQELTEYEIRAYCGEEYTPVNRVTTEAVLTIPNMMLDQWSKDGKIWNPWAEGSEPYWDTGNKGAATLGESNVMPTEGCWNSATSGTSALLKTEFKGIGSVGKLAAGSVYTGEFIRVDGTNGILNFGRPFTGRPTKLRGYLKYKSAPISHASAEYSYMMNRPDTAQIYFALADWPEPFEIRTNPKNQQLFDANSESVIAYGTVLYGEDVNEFTEFEVELDYKATNRVPRYILIVCAASKYGDFFTGGVGSTLNVSNLWLDWEY